STGAIVSLTVAALVGDEEGLWAGIADGKRHRQATSSWRLNRQIEGDAAIGGVHGFSTYPDVVMLRLGIDCLPRKRWVANLCVPGYGHKDQRDNCQLNQLPFHAYTLQRHLHFVVSA